MGDEGLIKKNEKIKKKNPKTVKKQTNISLESTQPDKKSFLFYFVLFTYSGRCHTAWS